jgi:hypothetical protein
MIYITQKDWWDIKLVNLLIQIAPRPGTEIAHTHLAKNPRQTQNKKEIK